MQVDKFNNPMDPAQILPAETMINIFGHLDQVSLGKCETVSKLWQELASDDLLWKGLLPKESLVPEGVRPKSLATRPYITSPQQLLERIRELKSKLHLFDEGIFRVELSLSPDKDPVAIVDFKWGRNDKLKGATYSETFIYTKALRLENAETHINEIKNTHFFKANIKAAAVFEKIMTADGFKTSLKDEIELLGFLI